MSQTIISIEGSPLQKLCLFHGLRSIEPINLFYLEDLWELPPPPDTSNYLDTIMALTQSVLKLCTLLQRGTHLTIVTQISPQKIHSYCQNALDLPGQSEINRTLYKNLVGILEDGLLKSHTVMIQCHSTGVNKDFLSREGRTLLSYRPLKGYEDCMNIVATAILNYIGFLKLPEEGRERYLTQNQSYLSGVNYGKIGYFNKFGTISYQSFYSGNSSFPHTLNCFTTVFHQ